jgi:hypothetical protein
MWVMKIHRSRPGTYHSRPGTYHWGRRVTDLVMWMDLVMG